MPNDAVHLALHCDRDVELQEEPIGISRDACCRMMKD